MSGGTLLVGVKPPPPLKGKSKKSEQVNKFASVHITSSGNTAKIRIETAGGESFSRKIPLEKKLSAYQQFSKKEFAKWKKENPGKKVDLPTLSKEISTKWKSSPERVLSGVEKGHKLMKKKK